MLIVLLLGVVSGIGAAAIASSKGRSGVGYFFLGFFFSLIGLLIAIGVSDRRQALEYAKAGNLCWACNRPRHPSQLVCMHCGASKKADPGLAGQKKCPACAELVLADAKKCKHCGEALGAPGTLTASVPTRAPAPDIGYCPACRKIRGMDTPSCVYCGSASPSQATLPAV